METYDKWLVINSDSIGLEARRNSKDPEEYGINSIGRKGNEIIPMLLLPRGVLQSIATESLGSGNTSIERMAYQTNMENTEFKEFLENGFHIGTLNAFIKSTYIQLARQGKIII